jgi:hypothetical protein
MNLRQQLGRAETMASFYSKQLEDYDGIVLRTSYTEPEDKYWLVNQIQADLDKCLTQVKAFRLALGITGESEVN